MFPQNTGDLYQKLMKYTNNLLQKMYNDKLLGCSNPPSNFFKDSVTKCSSVRHVYCITWMHAVI